jgi:HD-GYP domain-containing protein (c-di-GMP phosphodiesterase class II)
LSKSIDARFAKPEELTQRFEGEQPARLWIRPLVMQRSEQDRKTVIGELCIAYFERGHRFHPGRQRTLEVLAHHTEGLLTQRFLRNDIERSFSQTIQVLVQALEMHDEYTAGHSDWVGVYARLGALALGWDRRAVARAGHAGLLHDIGKVRLDSSMINHPGKLTDEQFEHFREHPVVGAEMLKPLSSMEDILPAVCWHHERFEGGGYPSGVAASLLPPLSRLMCIADSYDAMTSHRAYRRARSHHEAIIELRRCAGTQFDPEMVGPFIVATACFRRISTHWARTLLRHRKPIDPQSIAADLKTLFELPFQADELALDPNDSQTDQRLSDAAMTPFDLEDLAQVFFSLEASLEEATLLFLSSSEDQPSAQLLSQRLEEGSQRSDQRIERLIAEVYAENYPD